MRSGVSGIEPVERQKGGRILGIVTEPEPRLGLSKGGQF